MKLINSVIILVASSSANAADNLNKRQLYGLHPEQHPNLRNDLTFTHPIVNPNDFVAQTTFSERPTYILSSTHQMPIMESVSGNETFHDSKLTGVTTVMYRSNSPESTQELHTSTSTWCESTPVLYTTVSPSPKFPLVSFNTSTSLNTSTSFFIDTCTTPITSVSLSTTVYDTTKYPRSTVTEVIPLETSTAKITELAREEVHVTTYTTVKGQETSIICETITYSVNLQVENGAMKNVLGAGVGLGLAGVMCLIL